MKTLVLLVALFAVASAAGKGQKWCTCRARCEDGESLSASRCILKPYYPIFFKTCCKYIRDSGDRPRARNIVINLNGVRAGGAQSVAPVAPEPEEVKAAVEAPVAEAMAEADKMVAMAAAAEEEPASEPAPEPEADEPEKTIEEKMEHLVGILKKMAEIVKEQGEAAVKEEAEAEPAAEESPDAVEATPAPEPEDVVDPEPVVVDPEPEVVVDPEPEAVEPEPEVTKKAPRRRNRGQRKNRGYAIVQRQYSAKPGGPRQYDAKPGYGGPPFGFPYARPFIQGPPPPPPPPRFPYRQTFKSFYKK